MNWFFVIGIIVSLIIAVYLGFRGLNLFNVTQDGYFNTISKKIIWVIIIAGSLSFIVGRSLIELSNYWLPLFGNIVFSLVLCFFYSLIIIDITRFILYLLGYKGAYTRLILQIGYIALALIMFAVGLYMASAPRIVYYQVNIDKPALVKQLKIVQLSDIHIDSTTSRHFINKMVNNVNQLQPDYIFITGDTLDQRLQPYLDNNMAELFSQLNATYGTYIIFGNHEHYGIEKDYDNSNTSVVNAFEDSNMIVLQDNVFYDDRTGVTLVGRDDYSLIHYGKNRISLNKLIDKVNLDKPIILLDHQPQDLIEPAGLGIDIMFSGHTHAGQIFPMTLLVDSIYKNPWGMLQPVNNSPFISIVTSGYGLWGPPIRLMTRAEIVVTELNFK